jgi:hypothetical protein
MDTGQSRFGPVGKLAHVLYAVAIAILGALVAGAASKFGIVFFLLCLALAGYIVYRRFQHGKTIRAPWP